MLREMSDMKKSCIAVVVLAVFALCFFGCKSFEAITINSQPSRTVYGQGQDLDLSGLTVRGVYKDGTSAPITITGSHISGYDKHRVGDQTVVVRVNKQTATFQVTVVPLLSVSLISPPSKVLYKQGEALDITGLVVSAVWADPVGNGYYPLGSLTVSGYNGNIAGVQNIIISAEGRSASFTVDVKTLQTIAVQTPPTKAIYKVGEELDLRGLVVNGTWDGIGSERIVITGANLSGYEKNQTGRQTVVITAGGRTATFNVMTVDLASIRIVAAPVKVRYKKGEALELNGLEVWGAWEGIGSEKLNITAQNVTGYDPAKLGQQALTVRVGEKTAVFTVNVMGLSALRIAAYPKITYTAGEALDLAGLEVIGTYTDNSSTIEQRIAVTAGNVTGYNANRIGSQVLTITVEGISATFPVTVNAAPAVDSAAGPVVEQPPAARTLINIGIDYQHVTKWMYLAGESFDLTTVPVIGWYSDGTWASLNLAGEGASVAGYNSRAFGYQDVVIAIGALRTSPLRITVVQQYPGMVN
jgi:hypothetical protein